MKLSPFACILALAGCAATPKAERAYELRTTVYEMPTELAHSLTGSEMSGGLPAPASLLTRAREAAESRKDVEARPLPVLRILDGQKASIFDSSGTNWVVDYGVDAEGQVQDVQAHLEDGLEIELSPRAEEAMLRIQYQVTQASRKQVEPPIVARHVNKSTVWLSKSECLAVLVSGSAENRTTLVCVSAAAVAGDR